MLLVFPVTKWLRYHSCHLHRKNSSSFCCCKHPAGFVSAKLLSFDLLPGWHQHNSTPQCGCMCQTQWVGVQFQQASPCGQAQPFYHEFPYNCNSKQKRKCLTPYRGVPKRNFRNGAHLRGSLPGWRNSALAISWASCPRWTPAKVSECFPHSELGGRLGKHPTNPR